LFGFTSVDNSKQNVHSVLDGELTEVGLRVARFERKASSYS